MLAAAPPASRLLPALLLAALAAALAPAAHADAPGGFGVGPSEIDFGPVVRGEPVQRSIDVQNGEDAPARVVLRREGALAEAVHTERDEIVVPARGRVAWNVTLLAADLANGEHRGALVLSHVSDEKVQEGSGVNVALAVRVELVALVGGAQRVDVRAGDWHVAEAEAGGAFAASVVVENHGNVRITPHLRARVLTLGGEQASEETLELPPIVPGATRNDTVRLKAPAQAGQYRLEMALLAQGEPVARESRLLDALEPGSLRRRLEMGPLATADAARNVNHRLPEREPFVVEVPVRNVGEAEVEARFEGILLREGQLVRALRSDALVLAPGDARTLRVLVEDPLAAGTYVIRGETHYAGRVTEERETVLTLEPRDDAKRTPGPGAALLLLGLGAAALGTRARRG